VNATASSAVTKNDIPKEFVALQMIERVLEVDSEIGTLFLVKGFLAGLTMSDAAPFLVPLSEQCGKSQSRYVFLKYSAFSRSFASSSSTSSLQQC
jgi:hypothetical protein